MSNQIYKSTIATIIGARPQFVKAATISRVLGRCDDIDEKLIHTGQHYDHTMSSIFFEELEIPDPHVNLGISGGTHGAMTGEMLQKIEAVLLDVNPSLVLIYGDTNSTLAGALAASKLHIPIAHIEAGLRSFNRLMPEEINRILSDHVSDMLFCPTDNAVVNLKAEGIEKGVYHTGDVMYDATLFAQRKARENSDIIARMGLESRDFVLCTIHRAENTDSESHFRAICDYLVQVAQEQTIVFPVHPRTRQIVDNLSIELPGVLLIDPVGYFDLHALLQNCIGVFTDSGGLQKEAYFHGKKCVTLRNETEWVETVENGWNRLWREPEIDQVRTPILQYGDGKSAEKIVDIISRELL